MEGAFQDAGPLHVSTVDGKGVSVKKGHHMPTACPFIESFFVELPVHSRQTCYYKTCSQRTTKTNETALPSSTPHVLSSDSAKASNDRVEHSSQNSTLSSYFRAQRPL